MVYFLEEKEKKVRFFGLSFELVFGYYTRTTSSRSVCLPFAWPGLATATSSSRVKIKMFCEKINPSRQSKVQSKE
jgi:hypothetical protein